MNPLEFLLFIVGVLILVGFSCGMYNLQKYVERADYDKHKED